MAAQQPPIPFIFGDCTEWQIRLLSTIRQVDITGMEREEMFEALEQNHASITAESLVAGTTVAILNAWANLLGLESTGTRTVVAARIKNQAEEAFVGQPNAHPLHEVQPDVNIPTPANTNPRVIECRSLPNIDSQVEYNRWKSDIRNKAQIYQIWDVMEEKMNTPEVVQELSPLQIQQLHILKNGIVNSLGNGLQISLQPKIDSGSIEDSAPAVMNWVEAQVTALSNNLQKKSQKEFERNTWRPSKLGLNAWVAQQKIVGANIGRTCPQGIVLDTKIREMIMNNVGTKNPVAAHVINEFKQHELDEEGYDNDTLTIKLMKCLGDSEVKGELQCHTFAVNLDSNFPSDNEKKKGKGKGGGKQSEIQSYSKTK